MSERLVLRFDGLSAFGGVELAIEVRHAVLDLLLRLVLDLVLLLDHVPREGLLDRHRLLLFRWSILPASTEEHRAQQASRQCSHVEPSHRDWRDECTVNQPGVSDGPLLARVESPLAGLVIVLTGASEGIGRALALELSQRGLYLVLAARNAQRLEEVANVCTAHGSIAAAVPTDLVDPAQCRALIDATIARFGRIDVLINNAGGTMWARFDALDDLSVYERLMKVNYLGAVHLTAAALPWLKQTQGRLVAVASVAGLTGVPERSGYAASKHAMVGFFDSLRIELEESGVSVTIIAPGFVRSEIHKRAIGPDGQPLGASPMQVERIMTAEECARLIVGAIERRRRLVILSRRGRIARWLKLIFPGVVDRMAARAIRERH